jgi:hypothetical protein
MMENNFRKTVFAGIVALVAALGSGTMALAQDAQPEAAQAQPAQPQAMLDTTGKTSVSVHGAFGVGFSSVDVGTTSSGETVTISGGGGAGFGVGIGYGITRKFDVDLDLGGQASVLRPAVNNAEGTFTRAYLLATLKRKFPTSDTGQFKAGIGAGIYFGGQLDVDLRDAGGDHTVVDYDPAIGFHLTGEFERFIRPNTSITFGAKMYFVKYEASSYKQNGVDMPVGGLISDVKKLDGSGLDVSLALNIYF